MNRPLPSQLDQNNLIQMVTELVLGQLTSQAGSSPTNKAIEAKCGELLVDQKLVTTDSLPSGWQSAKTIRFQPKAIVTPAVVDLLRDQGISFCRSDEVKSPLNSSSSTKQRSIQSNTLTRGLVVLDLPMTSSFDWLERVCQSQHLQLLKRDPSQALESDKKHLLLSEHPFALQRKLAATGLHAIVGCKDFSETFDRMAFSNLLIMPVSTASWTIRQILKSWDHLGCQTK